MKLCHHLLLKISFAYSLLYKKRSCIRNINEITINMQTKDITRKIVNLQNIRIKYLIKTPLCINCKIIILCTQTHFSHVKEHI
jgi:hypothetical protein